MPNQSLVPHPYRYLCSWYDQWRSLETVVTRRGLGTLAETSAMGWLLVVASSAVLLGSVSRSDEDRGIVLQKMKAWWPIPSDFVSSTQCSASGNELSKKQTRSMSKDATSKGEITSEDPYENLSEDDDDETDCFLCRTNRQGPCQLFWRKFEHCVKDNSGKENESGLCDRYISPLEQCLRKYGTLYMLISMEVQQNDLEKLWEKPEERGVSIHRINEEQAQSIETKPSRNTTRQSNSSSSFFQIDWTRWTEFQETKSSKALSQTYAKLPRTRPLWKRFPESGWQKIFSVQVSSTIQVIRRAKLDTAKSEEKLVLRIAYAVDQDDNVIGCVEYYPPKTDNGEQKALAPEDDNRELKILLLPGMTETIQIKALYTCESKADRKRVFYESRRMQLPSPK